MTTIRYSVKGVFQRIENIFCRQTCRLFFCNDIDIPVACYLVLVQTKELTAEPFDPIADNGVADFFRYGDPEARPVLLPLPSDAHDKICAV